LDKRLQLRAFLRRLSATITGLIPAASRTVVGYRVYDEQDVHTLRLIQPARRLGFPVESIRQLLALWQDRSRASAEAKELALAHTAMLDQKLVGLQSMKQTLAHLIEHCQGDDRPDCPILDDLAGQRPDAQRIDIGSSIN
jgi:MerR family copper efflux transcriptional regulator